MSTSIKDGNNGYIAQVDAQYRIRTFATTEAEETYESFNGNSYNINTGAITLTSANESSVLYIKNNESFPLVISKLFYLIGNSTGGTGDMDITVVRNPTGGTLISNAVAVDINQNRNFGSSNTLDVLAYKGVEGDTCTGGNDIIFSIFNQSATRAALDVGTIIIPKGSSIAVQVDPGASNTSLRVAIAAQVFLATTR